MDIFEKLLNRSYNFLSYRPRSEKEVREYLKKKSSFAKASEGQENQVLEKLVNSIIEKLKEQKFLDDRQFTKWWIEQRSIIKPKALRIIRIELKLKGIGKDLIDEVLEDNSFEIESEYNKALIVAQKKLKSYQNESPRKIYEKMSRFLASKGFDWDIIKKVIDQLLNGDYNKERQ